MPASTERTALYRLYDADGCLLYIGITQDPARRFTDHASKPWWPAVAQREVTWHSTHSAARAAEVESIKIEMPKHNVSDTAAELPSVPAQRARVRHKQIADDLRSAIVHGRYRTGTRIPTEIALMAHYGAARGTVRQALTVLAQEGLTEARPGAGVFVRDSKPALTIPVPINRPSQTARLMATHMSHADLVTLTQALVAEIAKR